jgi:TRAP-type C4-dicarboxylate transport system permease small subunit
MTLMMLFITYAVINREFLTPVVGDVEIVQLGMVVLIMFGLAYSQAEDAHVSIGLLVDRFPQRLQHIIDAIAYTFTFAVCLIIGWFTFQAAVNNMVNQRLSTDLLVIPFFPFKFIIAIGFTLWGLEALLKVVQSISALNKDSA